jgi:hypothetical protein
VELHMNARSLGEQTAEIGAQLEQELAPRGFDVFHDHGPRAKHVGRIYSWFGDADAPARDTELGQIDIAVVERGNSRAIVLIEIEETNDNPKKIIGDVFGVLMGNRVTFRGTHFGVGPWTTLIVVGKGAVSRQDRNGLIVSTARTAQPGMQSGNHAVGEIVVESIADMAELPTRVRELVEGAIRRSAQR